MNETTGKTPFRPTSIHYAALALFIMALVVSAGWFLSDRERAKNIGEIQRLSQKYAEFEKEFAACRLKLAAAEKALQKFELPEYEQPPEESP